jgi:hypothetical protein
MHVKLMLQLAVLLHQSAAGRHDGIWQQRQDIASIKLITLPVS